MRISDWSSDVCSSDLANMAVAYALLEPGDTLMGMSLAHGGHLTHGAAPTFSGKWLHSVQYGVREADQRIDYDAVAELASEYHPKLIIAGGSAYSRYRKSVVVGRRVSGRVEPGGG